MAFPIPEHPRPRFGVPLAILLGLVALIAVGFAAWRELASPARAWRRTIQSADRQVRINAWTRLQRHKLIDGLDQAGTIFEVFRSLDDPDPETRTWAVWTIPAIGVDPSEAIARLAERLGDLSPAVRIKAAAALGEVVQRGEPGRDPAVKAIATALKDTDPQVRRAAVAAIGQVVYESGTARDPLRSGRPDDPALSLVADRLLDPDPLVQVEAAYVLACNDRGDEAIPMLASLVRQPPTTEPNHYLADRAFLALMVLAVHSDQAIAFFVEELTATREDYPDRPRDALAWAARQAPTARAEVKKLATKLLKSDTPSLRHLATILLHEIGSGESALQELIAALGDPSVDTRIRAVEALADLGDIDPTIVPALQLATSDANPDVREHARGALEAIEWDALMSESSL